MALFKIELTQYLSLTPMAITGLPMTNTVISWKDKNNPEAAYTYAVELGNTIFGAEKHVLVTVTEEKPEA
ncbi:MAG: hypothetical protein KKF33_20325 [Alphaproteobacteria bacterium]|nr:hypothetical protein [Alphaproteobacteria bacterium]